MCSSIRFQIAADSLSTANAGSENVGWAVQYVPAGATAQALNFN